MFGLPWRLALAWHCEIREVKGDHYVDNRRAHVLAAGAVCGRVLSNIDNVSYLLYQANWSLLVGLTA